MKNSITHRYYFCWCPRSKFHQPVYSSHYILQNVWMSTFNKHTLCYNIETSTICAISAYTFFSFSESLDISRCDFKTEMLIYIFRYIQLCPLIPVGPHFNKSSAVITWKNANFALYCLFWGEQCQRTLQFQKWMRRVGLDCEVVGCWMRRIGSWWLQWLGLVNDEGWDLVAAMAWVLLAAMGWVPEWGGLSFGGYNGLD